MNRLWVWISAIIVLVILFVAIFPFVYRTVTGHTFGGPRGFDDIPFDERDPERFREQAEKRIWENIARTMAVGALIALVAGVLLARWLVAPLRRLEEGAQAIANGKLEYRVPLRGSREMRSVANSFNQMGEELERQENLRQDMLADVTHELRHPIHILQGNLQAMLDGVYDLNIEEIDRLLNQTHSLTALVDDLHELALAEALELPLHFQEIDLVTLISDSANIFQILANENDVTIRVEVPERPIFIKVDPDRIRQALGNLLGNALRYSHEGGEILVVTTLEDDHVFVQIHDNGIGIALEDLPRVFDRFYRSDASRNRDLLGAGLGLPIAQALIHAHNGRITVESEGEGQGSCFTIILPMGTAEEYEIRV